jgi:hypothetical protein
MADNWPGVGQVQAGPNETDATSLYLRLADVFPIVMNEVGSDARVMGRLCT